MRQLTILSALFFSTAALADAPRVVTDIPAVHSLAQQVMGDAGQVEILLDQGADAHNFQMKPSQARALADADLVFWVGPELTPWLDRALAGIGTQGTVVSLLHANGVTERAFDAPPTDAAPTAGEDHDHDHEGIDPHAWLDPENARVWVSLIADQLAAKDPDNAAAYRDNAAAATMRIDALINEVMVTLKTAHQPPIIVFHDAYGYFSDRFDLNIVGSIRLGDATAPGAAGLVALRDTMRTQKVACVFTEAQHDPALAETVIEGTDIRTAPLDPSGSTLPFGPDLYTDLIRNLANTIADCTSGKG
ncbi:zinc ABC transporter substrate-binding protein [Pseudogemmobacter sp. W21_MBD1_M6]|uniref:zinc ABC transporter substrate-binding protein n=1 Tax=Pseudogemmobacter sp. W21_MBD1_M6 TaxID=3240271 RepID=UPI003F9A2E96